MLKKDWPKISVRTIKGAQYWILNTRRYHNGVRSGNEEYFNQDRFTLKQVEGRAAVVRQDVIALGHDIGSVNTRAKIEAADALDRLKPYGKTISQAVEFYVEHLEKRARGGVLLSKAIEDWVGIKKVMWDCGDIKKKSLATLKYRIGLLEAAFEGKALGDVSMEALETFFRDPKYSAQTRANIKAVASEFFLWCKRSKRWINENPCEAIEIKVKLDEVEILGVPECKKLLDAAKACPWSKEFYPYVLIGLFAGLRPSEIQSLDWKDINFETNEIRVDSEQVRYVSMNDDLARELLASKEKKTSGLIVPKSNFRKRWDYVRTSAGFLIEEDSNPAKRYPFDGMRHTFASFWLSVHEDRPRLAEIMGNSLPMLKRHYRRAIPAKQAEEFWNLIKQEVSASAG